MIVWDPERKIWINCRPDITPSSMVRDLDNINKIINQIKKTIAEDENKIKILNKQSIKVGAVIKSIIKIADEESEEVNLCIRRTKSELDDGLRGLIIEGVLDSMLRSSFEKDAIYDRSLEPAINEMKLELKEIEKQIQMLKAEIARKERDVNERIWTAGRIAREIEMVQNSVMGGR